MATRTLIVTLPPMAVGGVTAMVRLLADGLGNAGHEVTVAYYAPRRAINTSSGNFGVAREIAVRTRVPWLEQAYTTGSNDWRQLIAEYDRHVAVGGTVLMANPIVDAGVRHMIWCAADLAGDRDFRQQAMPWWRRAADELLVAPSLARQQVHVLSADNRIYGISHDTVSRLRGLAPARCDEIARLPIPIDIDYFGPADRTGGQHRIGFAGRLDDPRKNVALLFHTLARLRQRGVDATLAVTGNTTPYLETLSDSFGVREFVAFNGVLTRDGLRRFYQNLDVFVLASLQEGLAIAALEAMACGVPVVSTDCGGPADYIVSGENGALCSFDADIMADAIQHICRADNWRNYSGRARRSVEDGYNPGAFEPNLAGAWREVWGESL